MLNNNKIQIAIIAAMIILTIIILVSFFLPKILQSTKNQSQIIGNLATDKTNISSKNKPIVKNTDGSNNLSSNDNRDYKNNKNYDAQNSLISPTKATQQQSDQQTNSTDNSNLSKTYIPRFRPVTIIPTKSYEGNNPQLLADLFGLLFNFGSSNNSTYDINNMNNLSQNSNVKPTITPTSTNLSLKKTGIYLMSDYSSGAKLIVNAKPQVIKVMDPQYNGLINAVKDYKKIFPKGIVVLRFYEIARNIKYSINEDPISSAQDFYQKVITPGLIALGDNKKLFDYIETPNELDSTPGWESSESIIWLTQFWEELIALNNNSGIKTCIASIPVGNPPGNNYEIKEKLRLFLPALIKAQQSGSAVCYHAYTLKYTQDLNEEIYTSLRYRLLHQFMTELDSSLSSLRFILSEAGVDQNGNPQESGWQARGGAQQYMNWIEWFDREISQDSYVIGATLYQIGDNYWSSFNLEPITGWLAGKISN